MSNQTNAIEQPFKIHEVGEVVTVNAFFSKDGPEGHAVWDGPARIETVKILEQLDLPEGFRDGDSLYWVMLPTAPENKDCRECYMCEQQEDRAA